MERKEFFGFESEEFLFEGMSAAVVLPKKANEKRNFVLKTEYRDAFPEAAELPLLEAGWHVCFIKNENRWGGEEDLSRKARFVEFVQKEYHLSARCVPVGMSCGGLFAVKFATSYPHLVSCLYIDAPVVNYMSCPCAYGDAKWDGSAEVMKALSLSKAELLAYRDMPLDRIPRLVESRIPIVMVSGDSDTVVPYHENGAFIEKAYREAGLPFELYMKPGGDHHPHGLPDPAPVVAFMKKYGS